MNTGSSVGAHALLSLLSLEKRQYARLYIIADHPIILLLAY